MRNILPLYKEWREIMAINLIKRKKFLVVKKSKKMLQFVLQSCSIKNYVLIFLVWQPICECGERSSCFVHQWMPKKRLLPFLRSHTGNPLFWPDLASCHYSGATLNWHRQHKVGFVEKHCNPPNCPELYTIKRYWAIINGKLRFNVKEAKNIQDFKNKWIRATKKVQPKTMQKLMLSVKCKVCAFSCTQLHKLKWNLRILIYVLSKYI